MELYELKQHLVNKDTKKLYVFTGDEVAIMDIYINKIAETSNCKLKRVNEVKDVYSKLNNVTFLDQPSCYVIRDDKAYMAQESVWRNMKQGKAQGNNVIILVYTNLDKRSKFYKQHEDILVSFDKLSSEMLANYIKKEIGLGGNEAIRLAEMCDCNYSRILLECDKLSHLANANVLTVDKAFELAVKHKLIYTAPTDVIFEFIESVCKRNVKQSYAVWESLKKQGESPLAVISLLYTNFRSLLLVVGSGDGADLVKRTGLTPWQIKLAKGYGKHYSLQELVRILRVIRETEKNIKIGQIESDMAVDYILVNTL